MSKSLAGFAEGQGILYMRPQEGKQIKATHLVPCTQGQI